MIGTLHSKTYKYLLAFMLVSFSSGMVITNQLNIYVVIACPIIFINFLYLIFTPKKYRISNFKILDILLFILLIIVLFTAFYRGWGFEFLGSLKSGGMVYIKLIILILAFLTAINIKLTDKEKILLIKIFLLGAILPLISDILKIIFGFETIFSKFIPGSNTLEEFIENSSSDRGSIFRIQSCAPLSIALHIYFICFHRYLNENNKFILNKKVLLFIVVELILIILSGHRIALLENLLIFFYVYIFVAKKKLNIKKLLKISVPVIGFLIGIILSYNYLPAGVQRLFSFLPFLQENKALVDASASTNFRLILFANAVQILPDYFWIGKGFAFINHYVSTNDYFGIIEEYTEYGAFHIGEVGLIINLGIFGFLIGNIFLLKSFKFIQKLTTNLHIINLFKIIILLAIFEFVFIYGDLQTNFLTIIFYLFFLKILLSLEK